MGSIVCPRVDSGQMGGTWVLQHNEPEVCVRAMSTPLPLAQARKLRLFSFRWTNQFGWTNDADLLEMTGDRNVMWWILSESWILIFRSFAAIFWLLSQVAPRS